MAGYPTFTEIEVAWRASGSGLCIIVEGETELQDPWFYQQWFGGEKSIPKPCQPIRPHACKSFKEKWD